MNVRQSQQMLMGYNASGQSSQAGFNEKRILKGAGNIMRNPGMHGQKTCKFFLITADDLHL
jgi:hypothetical protein